jgi:Cu-Zn family superoxide dismutase
MLQLRRPIVALALILTISALGVGCAQEETAAPVPETTPVAEPEPMPAASATADFASKDGEIQGTATFTEDEGGVEIHVAVEGAPPGTHGFHIHEVGDCSADDFTSAGGHFNPGGAPHGGPGDAERHAGDLGNIEIGEDGSGHLGLTSDLLTVTAGDNSVVGRGVILHADADDLESQPTGAAGGRLACGVIAAG